MYLMKYYKVFLDDFISVKINVRDII